MAKLQRHVGTTSQIVQLLAYNTSGSPLTGLAYNTSGLTCYYMRDTASSDASVSLATMTLGTWASAGFKEIDSTNMPGLYQLGIPNAALATGADSVVLYLQGAASMAPVVLEIELTATNNQDGVRAGMTALPNAAAAAAGGLITIGTSTGQLAPDGSGNVSVGQWLGETLTLDGNNLPEVCVTDWDGTAVAALPTHFSSLAIDSSGRVTIAPSQLVVKKNTALPYFGFVMYDSNGNPATGLTVSTQVAIDSGGFGATTNSPVELSNGWYKVSFAAADLNGNVILFRATAAGAQDTNKTILTQP
jgi:hypothetical protein